MRHSQSLGERISIILARVASLLVIVFLIVPILVIIPLSFTSESLLTYPISDWSMRWYEKLWETPAWINGLYNSLIVAFGATALSMILGTAAAVALNRPQCPVPGLIAAFLMTPIIVPIIITAVGSYFFYSKFGLTNSFLGLILAHTILGAPFVVITVSATLKGFDPNQQRAAYSLGARPLKAFFTVTIPQIIPGVISGGLFAFVTSFDEVIVALFIAGIEQYTLPRQMFSGIRENLDPTIAAVATVMIAFSLGVLGIFQLVLSRSRRR